MRIYVASKFENTAEVHEAMEKLQALGHVVTHDWTHESPGDLKGLDLEEFMTECAIKDMYGVKTADVVLVINHPLGKGMWTEMGMAIAWSIPVFFCYPERATNIFTNLAGVETLPTLDEAIEAVHEFGQMVDG